MLSTEVEPIVLGDLLREAVVVLSPVDHFVILEKAVVDAVFLERSDDVPFPHLVVSRFTS